MSRVDCSSTRSAAGGQPLVTNEVVQDLRQNIFKLEEEVSYLLELAKTFIYTANFHIIF